MQPLVNAHSGWARGKQTGLEVTAGDWKSEPTSTTAFLASVSDHLNELRSHLSDGSRKPSGLYMSQKVIPGHDIMNHAQYKQELPSGCFICNIRQQVLYTLTHTRIQSQSQVDRKPRDRSFHAPHSFPGTPLARSLPH